MIVPIKDKDLLAEEQEIFSQKLFRFFGFTFNFLTPTPLVQERVALCEVSPSPFGEGFRMRSKIL